MLRAKKSKLEQKAFEVQAILKGKTSNGNEG